MLRVWVRSGNGDAEVGYGPNGEAAARDGDAQVVLTCNASRASDRLPHDDGPWAPSRYETFHCPTLLS